MDRIAPTRRPKRTVAGYQRWSELLFLHWPVKESDLRQIVPRSLTIDVFDGYAYVGLVPFAMSGVRPTSWWPRALSFEFLETNLRTYVHVAGRDPGVYFFSLDAASWLAVKGARWGWGLPYFHARMSSRRDGDVLTYHSRRKRRANRHSLGHVEVSCRITDDLGVSHPDTLEHFLFERYLLHVVRGQHLYTGQVHHTPYSVRLATLEHCEQGLAQAWNIPIAMSETPPLVHYSPGVDVEIFSLQKQPSSILA